MLLELPIMLLSKTSLLCLKLCSGILSDALSVALTIRYTYIYIMTPTIFFVEFITFNHCIHDIPKNFSSHFQNSCLCGMPCIKSLPIMLALCSMLLPSYYAPNYAGIIGSGLTSKSEGCCCHLPAFAYLHPMAPRICVFMCQL